MTKARFTVLILAIGLLLRAQAADDARVQQVDAIFAGLGSNQAPGAAVLVIGNGKNIYERGFGVTDLRTMHAIDAKTNFRLASVTKQFTAMAVMLLAMMASCATKTASPMSSLIFLSMDDRSR